MVFRTGLSWFSFSFGTMEGYNLPLYAISNFSTAAVNCNLWQYVVLSAITKAIGIWTMSMVFLLISMFWRNALIPFVADFGAAFMFDYYRCVTELLKQYLAKDNKPILAAH